MFGIPKRLDCCLNEIVEIFHHHNLSLIFTKITNMNTSRAYIASAEHKKHLSLHQRPVLLAVDADGEVFGETDDAHEVALVFCGHRVKRVEVAVLAGT